MITTLPCRISLSLLDIFTLRNIPTVRGDTIYFETFDENIGVYGYDFVFQSNSMVANRHIFMNDSISFKKGIVYNITITPYSYSNRKKSGFFEVYIWNNNEGKKNQAISKPFFVANCFAFIFWVFTCIKNWKYFNLYHFYLTLSLLLCLCNSFLRTKACDPKKLDDLLNIVSKSSLYIGVLLFFIKGVLDRNSLLKPGLEIFVIIGNIILIIEGTLATVEKSNGFLKFVIIACAYYLAAFLYSGKVTRHFLNRVYIERKGINFITTPVYKEIDFELRNFIIFLACGFSSCVLISFKTLLGKYFIFLYCLQNTFLYCFSIFTARPLEETEFKYSIDESEEVHELTLGTYQYIVKNMDWNETNMRNNTSLRDWDGVEPLPPLPILRYEYIQGKSCCYYWGMNIGPMTIEDAEIQGQGILMDM